MRAGVLLVLLVGAALARAEDPSPGAAAMTAGDLQQLCTGTDHVSRNACRIYILGVTQGIGLGVAMASGRSRIARSCVAADVAAEDLDQAVKARLESDLRKRPADASRDAAGFIAAVLSEAYPCH